MQERRIFQYLDVDELPASAHFPTLNETFNVVYYPVTNTTIGSVTGTITSTGTEHLEIVGYRPVSAKSNDPANSATSSMIFSDVGVALMQKYNTRENKYLMVGKFMNGSVISSVTSNMIGGFYPNGFLGYIKMRIAAQPLTVTNITTQATQAEYPIYIDTE